MAHPEPAETDAVSNSTLQQLSSTPYACTSLSPPLSSRDANVVYRGYLISPLLTRNSKSATSIIIKRSTEPKAFEQLVLRALASLSVSTDTATIRVPELYLCDGENNIQVLEDFPDTSGLWSMLVSADAPTLLPTTGTVDIGRHLGLWLRSFHDWTSAPSQDALRSQMWQNDHMRKTKYNFTYGTILKVLSAYPDLLHGHEKTLNAMRDFIAAEFERPATNGGEGYGLIHADFWTGNILLPSSGWHVTPIPNTLSIIDWEFTQFGHRSTDLGQIVGDLFERHFYRDLTAALPTMEGVIDGYGPLSDEMAFRTAMYVGAHLISWDVRRPKMGPRAAPMELVRRGLTRGRDIMLRAWERDKTFFEGSELKALFAR